MAQFVESYFETGNATEAYLEAYSCTNRRTAAKRGSELLRDEAVARAVAITTEEALELAGASALKVAKVVAEGLAATKTVDGVEEPDWTARLKAADMANKMRKVYENAGDNIAIIQINMGGQRWLDG